MWTIDNPNQMQNMFLEPRNYSEWFKKTIFEESIIDIAASRLLLQIKPAILQFIKSVLVGFELFLALWWLVGGGATS